MVSIKLPTFAGMVPSIDKHLLQPQNAQYVQDAWMYSGAINGLPIRRKIVDLVNPLAEVAYRIPLNEGDPSYLYDSYWVEFENPNTDFLSAPVADDTFDRYYFTSTSQVPKYNTKARIIANQPAWLLGLPQPGVPTCVPAGGGSTTLVSRAYLATLLTEYGEEGPASTPVLIASAKIDDTFTVTIPAVDANDLGVNRNVTKIRIYRTVVDAAGLTTYYRIAEITATAAPHVYADTASDAAITSSPILESTLWTAPPALDGFIQMPNGIMAGYIGKDLYFSEPYRPHAWPAVYGISLSYEIVGLAVVGQTLVACTKGNPFTISGVNPAFMTSSRIAAFEPCLSKGSILPTEGGVLYTSPNGLILVNSGYAQNITSQFISRDIWTAILDRSMVNAGRLGSAYYAFGAGISRAFDDDAFQADMVQTEVSEGTSDGFIIDPSNVNMGFGYLKQEESIKSITNDYYSSEMLFIQGGSVYWLDQSLGYTVEPFIWKSKVFQTPVRSNFGALNVYFYEDPDFVPSAPQNFNPTQTFDPNTQMAIVRIYADYEVVYCAELRTSGELLRPPSGFKANFWEIEIESRVKIMNIHMAGSPKELMVG